MRIRVFVIAMLAVCGCNGTTPTPQERPDLYVDAIGRDVWTMGAERYDGVDTVGEWQYWFGQVVGDTFVELDTLVWVERRVPRWAPDTLDVAIPVELSWYHLIKNALMFVTPFRPFPYYNHEGEPDTLAWYGQHLPPRWRAVVDSTGMPETWPAWAVPAKNLPGIKPQ